MKSWYNNKVKSAPVSIPKICREAIFRYLSRKHNGVCQIAKDHDADDRPSELHHAKIHNTGVNRKRFPDVVHSMLNLMAVHPHWHAIRRNWGRVKGDAWAEKWQRFLSNPIHERARLFVNGYIDKFFFMLVFVTCLGFCPSGVQRLDEIDIDLMPFLPAFLEAESGGKHYRDGEVTVSHLGAIGKWQVMPVTADFFNRHNRAVREYDREYTAKDLYIKSVNHRIGYWYLRYCYERFSGSLARTFNAYNRGHNCSRFSPVYVSKIIEGGMK